MDLNPDVRRISDPIPACVDWATFAVALILWWVLR